MTWQGGKRGRESEPVSPFARLKALTAGQDETPKTLESLALALRDFPHPVLLHMSLIEGEEGEEVEHWEIQGGTPNGTARRGEPKSADVLVVLRPETWAQIAQGRLAPYEALFNGKIRVGGDFAMGKAITRHLSDPAAKYVAPC